MRQVDLCKYSDTYAGDLRHLKILATAETRIYNMFGAGPNGHCSPAVYPLLVLCMWHQRDSQHASQVGA